MTELLKIDFGCGPNKREGFKGVDILYFDGVDYVFDAGSDEFLFEDNSVDEAHASHFLEHLTAPQRCHFFNELYRVLKPKAQCTIITPHWASSRAYGDPTHQWPPVCEFGYFYLSREWREQNAPHADKKHNSTGYNCDFDATWGYSLHPSLGVRNEEWQQFAINFYKEAAQDLVATITKKDT
jgi:ubiquinone/menaquinone biosynthesis C-methylase UbiE